MSSDEQLRHDEEGENMSVIIGCSIFKVEMGTRCSHF